MKHPLRRRWMYLGFLGLRAVARWLPLPVAQAFGRLLGYAAYGLLGPYRALALTHLRRAFGPVLQDSTARRITRGVFINLGKNALEWCVLERYSLTRIRRIVEIYGLTHLEQALSQGRGVIALSAHFGNWELLAMALRSMGFEGGVVARPLRYPEYQDFLRQMRARKGIATYDRGAVRDVARVLRANHVIGMMPDQDMDSLEGVFVDFFDQPTYTPAGPAALSLLTGSPIVPCFVVRDGRKFRVMLEEPLTITRTDTRTQDILRLTQQWSRVVESYLRRYPTHWVWMHRRWKTKPLTMPEAEEDGQGAPTQDALAGAAR